MKIFATLAKIRKEMKAEREIAGIVLPFAIGTALFIYTGCASAAVSAPALLSITVFLLGFLLYARNHPADHIPTFAIMILCMAACGGLSASTDHLLSVSTLMDASWLSSAAQNFGENMQESIDLIPFRKDSTGQIVKALLTGERSGIPEEIASAFRNSGASHILALSGLHLGIIYGIVSLITRCLGNTGKAKVAKSLILVSLCGFYTIATGAGASIVRAFIFILIGESARLSDRSTCLKKVMTAALLIHLTISPSSITEVGFQLSYAAIVGIAYIFPWLQGFWPGNRKEDPALTKCTRWIWDSASMSISCQITTGPLAYMYFGTFPTQFIMTNMIALPLTGLIIPMALITLTTCSLGWDIQVLINGTEWLITLLCEALDLLSTM
ncbi:MAG: ComEC/Rec2 family competence protein [Bacteroidales bacterium]|nr:ComEC/Rec2 family competence protein [Bacteroidales bacterium]